MKKNFKMFIVTKKSNFLPKENIFCSNQKPSFTHKRKNFLYLPKKSIFPDKISDFLYLSKNPI